MAPAKTGKLSNNKKAVIKIAQANKGNRLIIIPRHRMLKIVTIKLIAPAIDETPARCKAKIPASIDAPECAKTPLKGGYNVQPVPAPASTKLDKTNKEKDGGNSHREMLFIRGEELDLSDRPQNCTNVLPRITAPRKDLFWVKIFALSLVHAFHSLISSKGNVSHLGCRQYTIPLNDTRYTFTSF